MLKSNDVEELTLQERVSNARFISHKDYGYLVRFIGKYENIPVYSRDPEAAGAFIMSKDSAVERYYDKMGGQRSKLTILMQAPKQWYRRHAEPGHTIFQVR